MMQGLLRSRSSRLMLLFAATVFLVAGCSGGRVREAISGGNSSSGSAPMQSEGAAKDAIAPATSSSSGGASAGAPGTPGDMPLPSADTSRQIVRNGTADLEVKSVAEAFESVRQIAVAANGSIADSTYTGSGDAQSASLTLRVPVDRFGDVVAKLREVAVEVRTITTGSNDVTDEYTDIEATIRNLRAVETQDTQLLGRTGTIAEVLQVQDRLNQVRLQIDRTEARRQSLSSRAAMSTITVLLRPVAPGVAAGGGLLGVAREAWAASLTTLELIGMIVVAAVVYLWWVFPLAIAGWLVAQRYWRRTIEVAAEPPASV